MKKEIEIPPIKSNNKTYENIGIMNSIKTSNLFNVAEISIRRKSLLLFYLYLKKNK